jgi:hypothetical protein
VTRRIIGVHLGMPVSVSVNRGALPSAVLTWQGSRLGHVHVAVEGAVAELQDVWVEQRAPMPSGVLWTFFGRPRLVPFRGSGWGTRMLTVMLEVLTARGVAMIQGEAVGEDVPRLLRWYASLGFETDSESGRIYKRLDRRLT